MRVVLALDEMQALRGVVDVASLLAYVYDNLSHLVVVTGSQASLVYDVLRLDVSESPTYGRSVYEVRLRRLAFEEALDFLKRGFAMAGTDVERGELEEAVEALDGIIG